MKTEEIMKIMKMILTGITLTLLIIYAAGSLYFINDRLNTNPEEFFFSTEIVEPTLKELSIEHLDDLKNNIKSIKHIVVFRKDEKDVDVGVDVIIRNADSFKNSLSKNGDYSKFALEELMLQAASGSGEAFANHCHWDEKHDCYGASASGDGIATGKACSCVKKTSF